jgi:hypothetical protein
MTDTLPKIRASLEQSGLAFEIWPCNPEMADTVQFCAHCGVPAENSANSILLRSKTGEARHALCVLLASEIEPASWEDGSSMFPDREVQSHQISPRSVLD